MNTACNRAELAPLAPVTIVTGHYGTGKTNFSLNLALHAKNAGQDVTVMDVDIVNPYFRSSDYTQMLEGEGIRVVAPVMAQSMLDTPSLPAAMDVAIKTASPEKPLIIDMGGDDEGAKAMGRFAELIKARPEAYVMYYVVNERREIETPEETAAMLREIEDRCYLKATGVVNNTIYLRKRRWRSWRRAFPSPWKPRKSWVCRWSAPPCPQRKRNAPPWTTRSPWFATSKCPGNRRSIDRKILSFRNERTAERYSVTTTFHGAYTCARRT